MEIVTIVLRLLHIIPAVFWVGAAWITTFFIEPTATEAGQEGGKFLGQLMTGRRLSVYITVAAILTVLAGWTLWILRYGVASLSTPTGLGFAIGGVFGLIGLAIGGAVTGPTANRMARLAVELGAAKRPPTPEQAAQLAALQSRLRTASLWSAIFASLALLLMATARYL